MTALVYPVAPQVLPTQHAAQRVWHIRRLLREGALDLLAADTALRQFRVHPHPAIARLAAETTAYLSERGVA